MNKKGYISFYVVALAVVSISAADVYIINTKSNEKALSASIGKTLQAFHEILRKNVDETKTPRIQLLNVNVGKTGGSREDSNSWLRPVSPHELTKTNLADLLNLVVDKADKVSDKKQAYRLFKNMYGGSKKIKALKKPKKPVFSHSDNKEILNSLLKYIIPSEAPKFKAKHQFQDMTRFDKSNASDVISRNNNVDRYSRDYIDFDDLRYRRNDYPAKPALRMNNDASESTTNEESGEDTKSKRFEIVLNKQNKKYKKHDETGVKIKKMQRPMFKKINKKVISMEEAGTSLSSESKERVVKKHKKRQERPKKKQKHLSEEKNDKVQLYLQGNKVIMYPPMEKDSSDDSDSDGTRRSQNRLPYFLPKRYYWNMDDIYNLGYYFFNGPKGVSLEDLERPWFK